MRFYLLLTATFFLHSTIGFSQLKKTTPTGLLAKVVKIIDGDTVDVLEKDSTCRIRLYGIDAPEQGQAFYKESKEKLEALMLEKEVYVELKGKDKYGRQIATIIRKSDNLNINYEMVRTGMAWHFIKYASEPEFAKLEAAAREKELGLWSQYYYLEPWEFRKSNH